MHPTPDMHSCSTPFAPLVRPALLLACLAALLAPSATAQSFHRDCGAGQLYDATAGACGSAEAILSRQGTLYWVSQETGSDTNPGTKSHPWKTIARANLPGQLSPGDAVLIRAGIYREEIRPREAGQTGRLITFSAYPGDEVLVSGSDVVNRPGTGYAGWVRQGDGSWRHDWDWDVLPSEGSPFADRRRELFAVNGSVLRQLSGTSRPNVERGQFWVQGPDTHPVAVYLRTSSDANPNQQLVEVGQRDLLFQPASKDVCTRSIDGFYRLILLRFTHSTAKRQRMAVCAGSEGSQIEEIETVWNNAGGIQLSGRNHLVRGATASYNGIEGIGASGCNGCTVEYSTIQGNHWKWWQEEGGRAHGGGGKYANTTHATIRYNTYSDNEGSGIWFDEHSHSNEIYGNIVDGNLKQGIQIELHSNDNRIYSNVVTRTRNYSSIWNGIGISISVSNRNLVAYNTIIGNEGTGIRVGGDNRGTAVETMVYNNLILGNTLSQDASRGIMMLGSGIGDNGSPWDRVQTNRVDGNGYSYRDPANVLQASATFMLSPSGLGDGALYANQIGEWQEPLGFDGHGLVANPVLPTVIDLNDPVTGWLLAPGSQFAQRAVPLPAGVAPILTDVFGNGRPLAGGSLGAHELDGAGYGMPDPGASPVVFAVNAGGKEFTAADGTVYQDDTNFSYGQTQRTTDSIEGTTDDVLYQSERFGQFAYHVPVVPGTYEITFQFAELTETQNGARRFDIEVEGQEVVSNLDIHAAVGRLRPLSRSVTVEVSDGDLNIRFLQDIFAPKLSALAVRLVDAEEPQDPDPDPDSAPVLIAINAGGDAFTATDGTVYQADALFSYGRTRRVTDPIAGTTDDVLYQSERFGRFAYHVPVAPGSYEITFQFAELTETQNGARRFDINVEGQEVVSNLDIHAVVGARRAYSQSVTVDVADDVLNIRFMQDIYAPKLSGLVIRSATNGGVAKAGDESEIAGPMARSGLEVPETVEIGPGAPNPTRDRATFQYGLPESSQVRVEAFDMLGRSVGVLEEGTQLAGWHRVTFDGSGLPSGVYVVRLQAGRSTVMQRLTLSR